MGAWAEHPLGNDSALDLISKWEFTKRSEMLAEEFWIPKVTVGLAKNELQRRGDYTADGRRAMAYIVARSTKLKAACKGLAIDSLLTILKSDEHEQWTSPKKYRASVRTQISELRKPGVIAPEKAKPQFFTVIPLKGEKMELDSMFAEGGYRAADVEKAMNMFYKNPKNSSHPEDLKVLAFPMNIPYGWKLVPDKKVNEADRAKITGKGDGE